jgi:hypothetical protein
VTVPNSGSELSPSFSAIPVSWKNGLMLTPRKLESYIGSARGKAFLFGLYVGLSLLLFVSWLDPARDSFFHKATNIYGVQALAGAMLGGWRIWKRAENPKASPAIPSLWICMGLTVWAMGQAVWIWATVHIASVPYPWWSDLLYLGSDLFWLVALFMIYKSLRRPILPAINPFTKILIPIGVSLLLTGLPTWIAARVDPESIEPWVVATDFVYIFLTFSSLILAIGLVVGENSQIPYPLHQCIRYLCAATAVDAIANMAFTVTVKLPATQTWGYYNGNWVDWLFLTAMYCWGASTLKWPIRPEQFEYTFHTRSGKLPLTDIYRAVDIEEVYPEFASFTDPGSIEWILKHTPSCWRVIKLGRVVIGSTFLFPVPRDLIKKIQDAQTSVHQTKSQEMIREIRMLERKVFDEAKKRPITWECLYLADASILRKHRGRGLAFMSFKETIESIADEHKNLKIEVFCRPTGLPSTKLALRLRQHFEARNISVRIIS